MLFVDLLRLTVLLIGGSATALGAVTVLVANRDSDSAVLILAGGWWALATVVGLVLGGSAHAGEAMSRALAAARTATTLPTESPGRIAFLRLWPIGAFALIVGGLAWLLPQVAAVGTGFAILNALAWRNRERAVTAIEERDAVRFYVEPSSALEPIKLIRTPGLGRDRMPAGHPPPPPPEPERNAVGLRAAPHRGGVDACGCELMPEGRARAGSRDQPGRTGEHEAGTGVDRLAQPAGDRTTDRG